MIRVQVVHEESLFRSALVALLRNDASLEVWDGDSPVRPDVRVLDAEALTAPAPCPGSTDCTECPSDAGADGAALLVLATAHKPGVLRKAFDAGALGYVDKFGTPSRLVEGIHVVARGERYVDHTLGVGFLLATRIPLTPRELSVLAIAAEGASVAEIAGSLHLSLGTIRNYMAAAIRKVGARNRVDAIRISRSAGWM